MILTDREIRLEVKDGNIEFDPGIEDEQVGDASVDLRLGRSLRIPQQDRDHIIRPSGRTPAVIYGEESSLPDTGYNLPPNQLILGHTLEKVTLPNYLVGRLEGKSSLARFGLMIHVTSGHIDPGFSGVIVLEIYNLGVNLIALEPLMPIAHIVFSKVSTPPSKVYSGQFADQITP